MKEFLAKYSNIFMDANAKEDDASPNEQSECWSLDCMDNHSSTTPRTPKYLSNPSELLPPTMGRYGDPLDPAQIPKAPFCLFSKNILDEQFRAIWAIRQSLVVSDLLDNFSIKWTPHYFH
ncbi:hypothetical protein M422DRAFT_52928 [Sphaerobolus stellatus SS14]|uniref:Uncharacterized protein n=1 Tax=Sphaerobolus stellatus (strain SS14) TaxID=990650 RepID=A0A0C9TQH5_SPHS4|nr:hypothetical protein M422DRAFT_52928 [Sphaerobolus stellatus SS14]